MGDNAVRKQQHNDTTPSPRVGHLPTRKISAPVQRTTTESIRLDSNDTSGKLQAQHHHHHHGQSLGAVSIPLVATTNSVTGGATSSLGAGRQKKTSSFQITSVTVGCRMSNDTGEDSNDDLDESHTEDNSVEHSRITDIETPSYSEDTFSKDDVFFNTSNAALSTAPVIPTSSQYGLAIVPSSEANNTNNSNNENNINALDIASVTDNNIINLLSSNAKQDADLREVHSHGRNERFKVVKIESTEPFKRGRWTCMDYLDHTSVNQPVAMNASKVNDPNEVCVSYGVSDTGVLMQNDKQVDDKQQHVDANGMMHPAEVQQHPTGYVVPPQYFQSSQTPQQQQQQTNPQGATLPTNLQGTHAGNIGQTQSMPQGTISMLTQPGCAVTQGNNVAQQPQQQHPTDDSTTYVSQAQAPNSQPPLLQQTQQQQQQPPPATPQPTTQDPMQAATMQAMPGMQNIHTVPQANAAPQQQQPQQMQSQSQVMAPQGQMQPGPPPQQQQKSTGANNAPVQIVGNMPFQHQQQQPADQEQDSKSSIPMATVTPGQTLAADAALLESLAEVTQNAEDQQTHEDNESMSGTSAVAIDNKIEQAMDLVKSHLMFAVREEVEVLKEKIAELMDRINQLEAENSILKAHATLETLAQLNQSTAAKMPPNTGPTGQ
ncbi:protein bunched, class 2/F/G isoform [Phymastichus coffea]|uniref:protein bunched, class 2/F/G isoform n=1 Tax=Phymastichus coffea TaxID=108790 RepID=UPI00273B6B81|nr:protein bunched, class 2/F/G isoform [Phymastichus coffea]